jgi:hypothetical protein
MSDLTDDLRHLAEAAAHQARPLPAGEVIRRGDLRRRRTIAQRTAGGLSAIGVVGVAGSMLLSSTPAGPGSPAAAGAVKDGITLTETTTSAAGIMTVTVRYRLEPHRKLQLLAVRFSGASKKLVSDPALNFALTTPTRHGVSSGQVIIVPLAHAHSKKFSGAIPRADIVATRKGGGLVDGETLTISLTSTGRAKGGKPAAIPGSQRLQLGMILTPVTG